MFKTLKAYAKINLHLDISGIREDGYHNVEIVMQTLSLADIVSVSLDDDGNFYCECNSEFVPIGKKNIAVRAAMLYMSETGLNYGVRIKIEKNIPISAGLAGGSADAAATLIALNALCENKLSEDKLLALGSILGADVPFCIRRGCAYTDGRGDVLHSFPQIPKDTVFLVACGGEGVSTPWAYGIMDRIYDDFVDYKTKGTDRLREVLLSNAPSNFSAHLFNIFEAPVLSERPTAFEIKQTMLELGAISAMMSGSGPSVYGIFENTKKAEMAEHSIKEKGFFATVCYPV